MAKYWKIILPSDHTAYKLLSLQPVWPDVWIKSYPKVATEVFTKKVMSFKYPLNVHL